jgi:septum formation protein
MLILASGSPRRQELLTRLGVPFDVARSDVDETPRPGEPPIELVQRLAREKALAVAQRFPERPVLGADTIVVLDGLVLGKPADAAEATAMLQALRGRSHTVHSAFYARNPATGQQASAVNETLVWMRDYGDAELAAYVASGDPLDKAGAYAIQSAAFVPVERIDGCFSSVMGFALADVAQVLRQISLPPPTTALFACRPLAGWCCQESGEVRSRE